MLWNAVRTDALSAISTDHCAFLWDGQKTLGKDDFSKIPNGGPGLENRLHMIHEFGARAGRISLNRMVELLATSPAKLFGLYPKKGTVAVGSDADLVIFDPERKHTITAATQHSKTDYNLYEGTEVTGTPEVVLLRGNVLVEGDELVASPGIGQYVARASSARSCAREERDRLRPAARGRTGCSGAPRGPVRRVQARDQVQRHVDPGRDAGGGDHVAVVDEAVVRPHLDLAAERRQQLERPPVRRRRLAVEQPGRREHERAGADAGDDRAAAGEAADPVEHRLVGQLRRVPRPPG